MKNHMSTHLPTGKTIVHIFADFMSYLFDSTGVLFKASEPHGESRWGPLSENVELVLSHPNGWGGPQQAQLRTAAILAGIVSDTPAGRSRVHFVTEGEASFNFCASHTPAGKHLKVCYTGPIQSFCLTRSQVGEQILVIDAGGGTIDVSTYMILGNWPLRVEELNESECEWNESQCQTSPFDISYSRLAPRWRVRYGEGEGDGPRCVFWYSSHRPIAQPPTREVVGFQIQHL